LLLPFLSLSLGFPFPAPIQSFYAKGEVHLIAPDGTFPEKYFANYSVYFHKEDNGEFQARCDFSASGQRFYNWVHGSAVLIEIYSRAGQQGACQYIAIPTGGNWFPQGTWSQTDQHTWDTTWHIPTGDIESMDVDLVLTTNSLGQVVKLLATPPSMKMQITAGSHGTSIPEPFGDHPQKGACSQLSPPL